MFNTLHKANLRITLICTPIYFTGYGLLLMFLVGIFQLATIPTLWINRSEMSTRNKNLFYTYLGLVLSLFTITFLMLKYIGKNNGLPVVIMVIGGGILSLFHLWITKKVKEQEEHDI